VLTFLNEPWSDAVLEAHAEDPVVAGGNVNQHVFTTSTERWKRDLLRDELDAIEAVAGPLMQDCGYPLSQALESVPQKSNGGGPV
jgi:hypothetical protein